MVNSRFVASEYSAYGIDSLRVTRVTRIHNRQLRNRFEERLEATVNTTDLSYKRSLECDSPSLLYCTVLCHTILHKRSLERNTPCADDSEPPRDCLYSHV